MRWDCAHLSIVVGGALVHVKSLRDSWLRRSPWHHGNLGARWPIDGTVILFTESATWQLEFCVHSLSASRPDIRYVRAKQWSTRYGSAVTSTVGSEKTYTLGP